MKLVKWVLTPSDFMPHGYCYRWVTGLVWLHGLSDSLIFLAYMSIPITLMYIVIRRKDLPFNWIFVCFGVFIVACGLTHAIEVWNLWHAMFWLAGLAKAVTAVASIATAILLIYLVPQALNIPSINDMHAANATLKEQASALRASENKFRGLLEAAPDAIVVVSESGKIVLLNLQAEKQFGYRREELLNESVRILIPERFQWPQPAHRRNFSAHAGARGIRTDPQLFGRRKDGSEFPAEIMLNSVEGTDGILVTTAIRDITERKRAEETLRESEERFRLIVSNVKDYAILMLDTEGRVVSWNEGAERIKGYKAEEIIGQHFSRFYLPEDIGNEKPAFELAEATRTGRSEDEGWRVRKDGSRFYANVVITALRDEEGQLRGFGKITRDITHRKKYEEHVARTTIELKRSNDELLQFANVASHDLQEPLRMVASYTQLLATRYQGRLDSDADEFIAYAVDGCNRMQGLIQDLLAYSRSGANGKPHGAVSSGAALTRALANLQAAIEESGAIVTHDSLPIIMTDETQLTQVLQNLVGNAIKYRGVAVPHVHISATKNGSPEWIFSVRDNGLGIESQYFEKIFIIFQRLHAQHEFRGSGIGLAICKKVVERLGGRIWVESQLEKGSTFFFALPETERT